MDLIRVFGPALMAKFSEALNSAFADVLDWLRVVESSAFTAHDAAIVGLFGIRCARQDMMNVSRVAQRIKIPSND